jgi:thiol:disulfide interchange protein
MGVGEIGLGILIGLVVLVAVLFYAVARQHPTIEAAKTPQLPAQRQPPAPSKAAHVIVHVHAGQALAEQLRAHANAAEAKGLRPFLEVGAIWCPPSKLFGDALTDPRMEAALAGVYLIRADMDEFGSDPKLGELGVAAVPVFFELDADGQATGRSMTGAAWGADTIENMSGAIAKFCA